jgi:energy-converting hydrogenase Eha subunit A
MWRADRPQRNSHTANEISYPTKKIAFPLTIATINQCENTTINQAINQQLIREWRTGRSSDRHDRHGRNGRNGAQLLMLLATTSRQISVLCTCTTPRVIAETPGGTKRAMKQRDGVKENKSTIVGATANLINAIVGSGIVGIPSPFNKPDSWQASAWSVSAQS